jgi:hypothetical protein
MDILLSLSKFHRRCSWFRLQDVFAESDTFVMVMETADMTLSTFLEATEEGMPESESKVQYKFLL